MFARCLTLPRSFRTVQCCSKIVTYACLIIVISLVFYVIELQNRYFDVAKNMPAISIETSERTLPQNNEYFEYRNILYQSTEDRSVNVTLTADEFRLENNAITGNPVIDNYVELVAGMNYTVADSTTHQALDYIAQYNLNVLGSDSLPLDRIVPDSRPPACRNRTYPADLPTASIIIPFHNEWPSVLLRTVYSVINRSPRRLIREIVLVDDASNLESLGDELSRYIDTHFPRGLVKLIRTKERGGLIKARLLGWKETTSDVIIVFDSHMEVNYNWLPPLLTQIKIDPRSVAMATLDYIKSISFKYHYYKGYQTRYGFDWRLAFFETFWRSDQKVHKGLPDNKPGPVMVGAAFAIDSKYFAEIGAYDEGMKIWGGENLELSWRVWLCGGSLIHVPCSHIGHVARGQPYTFPEGRLKTEIFNYKRAVDVWMPNEYKKFVYNHYPQMEKYDVLQNVNTGDISDRLALKSRLACKPFSWFIENIWPELHVLDYDAAIWGMVSNVEVWKCLDNSNYLFAMRRSKLTLKNCTGNIPSQGVSLQRSGKLMTSLHCVVAIPGTGDVALEDCIEMARARPNVWKYLPITRQLLHRYSQKCLSFTWNMNPQPEVPEHNLMVTECNASDSKQQWIFISF